MTLEQAKLMHALFISLLQTEHGTTNCAEMASIICLKLSNPRLNRFRNINYQDPVSFVSDRHGWLFSLKLGSDLTYSERITVNTLRRSIPAIQEANAWRVLLQVAVINMDLDSCRRIIELTELDLKNNRRSISESIDNYLEFEVVDCSYKGQHEMVDIVDLLATLGWQPSKGLVFSAARVNCIILFRRLLQFEVEVKEVDWSVVVQQGRLACVPYGLYHGLIIEDDFGVPEFLSPEGANIICQGVYLYCLEEWLIGFADVWWCYLGSLKLPPELTRLIATFSFFLELETWFKNFDRLPEGVRRPSWFSKCFDVPNIRIDRILSCVRDELRYLEVDANRIEFDSSRDESVATIFKATSNARQIAGHPLDDIRSQLGFE